MKDDVESGEDPERRKTVSPLGIRVIGFIIACVASVFFLALIGATPILILEVFGLAAILAISAIVIIIAYGRGPRMIRKRP